MRTKHRDVHFLVVLSATNTIQSISNRRKSDYFSKLFMWPASGLSAGLLVANAATIYVGKDGDGPLVTPDAFAPGDTPYNIILPDGEQMKLEDVLIQGTAGDGFFVSYTPVNPEG